MLTEDQIIAVFNEIDTNGDGEISSQEFLDGWRKFDKDANYETATKMFGIADRNKNGTTDERKVK